MNRPQAHSLDSSSAAGAAALPARLSAVLHELPQPLQDHVQRASELQRQRRRQHSRTALVSTFEAVDELLGGGLPRGALIEIVGRGSSGRFAALLAALRTITAAGEAAALVDQGAHLDPQAAADAGIDLERLLWLRPLSLPDSLAAAEMLIHTGFPLVALDLGLPPVRGRAPLAAWLRLARCCAEHQAVALAGVPYRLSGCAADAVLLSHHSRGRWARRHGAPSLLEGLTVELQLQRQRGRRSHPRTTRLELAVREALGLDQRAPDSAQPSSETMEVNDVQAL